MTATDARATPGPHGSAAGRPRTPTYRLVRAATPTAVPVPLDAAQSAIVAHRSGPLLVLGGPGTGKTTALVEAVVARVAEGEDPATVVVLTFGRRSAARLRDRIEARIGQGRTTMSEPVVRTFPAYAFGLIRRDAAERGEPAPRLLTGPEQDAVLRDLLADPDGPQRIGWPAALRQAVRTRAFAAELRDLLLRATERGIGASGLTALGTEQGRADWVAAARFLREYQEVLDLRDATSRGSVAYDQAELVRYATRMLRESPRLLADERRRCKFVYVDELADTDPAQLELLSLIAGGGAHLVGFADPDSSTFAFRGADLTSVTEFASTFRTASGADSPQLTLSTSYRGLPELVAAGRAVAARLRGPVGHRRLVAAMPVPAPDPDAPALPPVEICTLGSIASESAYVAHRLREAHLRDGIPWSRMAVVVRSLNRQHAALRRALAQNGVPVATPPEDLPLQSQPAVAHLLALLRCALEPGRLEEEAAVALLHSPFGRAEAFAERQLRQGLKANALAAGDRRPSGELLVEALNDPRNLVAVADRWARPAKAVATLIATAREAAARPGSTAEDVLWSVWQASGLTDRWAAASARGGAAGAAADRDLDAVLVLFDAAARFTDRLPGARIEAFLSHLFDQQLPADTLAVTADRGEAVRVLTAHAAKGLEWDVVVVTGVQEGVWPDLRLRGSVLGSEKLVDVVAGRVGGVESQVSGLLDEERRLFYVAVTRARLHLLVTAVDASSAGGPGEEQPSRFLGELVRGLPDAAVKAGGHESTVDGEHEPGVAAGVLPRPLTLPALVAELRVAVADASAAEPRRRAAAATLARLAAAGVPGADPAQWWGLAELSDARPLVEAGKPVRVSPSTVESVERCGLRWLLERHGGSDPPTGKQGLGNLVHAAAMLTAKPDFTASQLHAYVAARFDGIELDALWQREQERGRAEKMVDKLLGWVTSNTRELLDVELAFTAELQPAQQPDAAEGNPVQLRGRVDRLERDAHGRLVVVDLKTGASAPSREAASTHPQLGAYQVAVAAGAFGEAGTVPGGAEIVAVGTKSQGATVRTQAPIEDAAEPEWAEELVRHAGAAMAASTFEAIVNESCAYCPVRTACPVSGKGRQVTEA